jgi:hypothetical protein
VIALVGGYRLIGNDLSSSVTGLADQVGNA